MPIKAIIFDFGGPIVEWRSTMGAVYRKYEDLHKLGRDTLRKLWQEYDRSGGVGTYHSFTEFIRAIKPNLSLSLEQLNSIFNESYAAIAVRPEMVAYARELKKKYRIALLSNYVVGLEEFLENHCGIYDLFDPIVSSYNIKIRKPDPRAYLFILEKLGLKPEECIFIDDLIENVEAAEKLGIRAIVFENSAQCRTDLDRILAGL